MVYRFLITKHDNATISSRFIHMVKSYSNSRKKTPRLYVGVIFLDSIAIHVTNADVYKMPVPHLSYLLNTRTWDRLTCVNHWCKKNGWNHSFLLKQRSYGIHEWNFRTQYVLDRDDRIPWPFNHSLREVYWRCKYSLFLEVACGCIKTDRNVSAYDFICIH